MPGNDTTHQHHNGGGFDLLRRATQAMMSNYPATSTPNWPGQKLVKLAASLQSFGMMRHYMARGGKKSGLEASSGRWDAAKSGDRRSHIATGEGAYDPAKVLLSATTNPLRPSDKQTASDDATKIDERASLACTAGRSVQQQTDR
ncbi:hypothetical protein MY5147_004385 [Beauveria neobassiana]